MEFFSSLARVVNTTALIIALLYSCLFVLVGIIAISDYLRRRHLRKICSDALLIQRIRVTFAAKEEK